MTIKPYFRKLNRTSSHRQSLLRNIVSCLIIHESILTTLSKAKEVQKIADNLITYAKKGLHNSSSYKRVQSIVYKQEETIPKLYGVLSKRFFNRSGGYTRILKLPPRKSDSAPMALIEYIDGPNDTRFLMTAKVIIHNENVKCKMSEITMKNIKKVTDFREKDLVTLKNAIIKFRYFFSGKKKTINTI